MLRLALEHVKPGMVTSRNIYGANGSLLLARDHILDRLVIERLANMDIDAVYVKNPFSGSEAARDILYESTRIEAVRLVQKTFEGFRRVRILELHDMREVVGKIVDDILNNRDVLLNLTDIRTRNDYTFGHSVNVCLISALIGVKMQLEGQQLTELATGAILHDVGMMSVPPALLNKKDKLTPEEWEVTKGHTGFGFDILRMQAAVSLPAAYVAYQHHENFDGTGYPKGIRGETIHQYARIAAIADIYDSMTSERAYRPARQPHEVYAVMQGSRGTMLDPRVVDLFLASVVLFPEGTMVQLDGGEIGVVVRVEPKLQARPTVRVVGHEKGLRVIRGRIIDLTREGKRSIVKVYKPEEVVAMKLSD
ncbi:MAG: HD-GYP domain-containing protein [Negativicutes bacterium]|nr:HD-GYP domain-containing protein [Negativicutes bacterium]